MSLKSQSASDRDTNLPCASDPELFESRAIVLKQLGQHKQALQVYVFQIQNYEKAEDYCNQLYLSSTPQSQSSIPHRDITSTSSEDEDQPSIYHTLLSLYLSPPPPHETNLEPALDLLSRHGARLPASQTLDLIPAKLPIKDLENYFRGRIRHANSLMRLGQIERGLLGVERSHVEAELLIGGAAEDVRSGTLKRGGKGRNRRVVISEDRHCAVCFKRFGSSAIRVYPDNTVVHYGCFPKTKQDGLPVAARKFSGW